jgi:hypothetical protein
MNRIALGPQGEFSLEGENFIVDMSTKTRRPSDTKAMALLKSQPTGRSRRKRKPAAILDKPQFDGF